MRKYLDNVNWRKVGKIAVVAVPVLVWDMVYFIITKLYQGATVVDKAGEKFLDGFMEK